ncbi:Proteasome component (PCI) domain-containing protein [Artemisia annua]|uniref:Proteasome component (PCI) domain-containing protein n=1 Tax=Artemisia annua TaxID=35608 RepID=A0A2U1NQR0_ARTAN|nr:Proteasome component (PCI) domain-containing protein [Artemisia annua]
MREEINEVVAFLQNPRAFQDMGARAPRGVLIVGERGTGKTKLALAIAAEAKVPVIEVSQVYQTMKVETLSKMFPFFDFSAVEWISVDAVKHSFISMKVDHMKGAIIFGDLGFQSDILQDHLSVLAVNFSKSRSMIYPSQTKASKLSAMLPGLAYILDKEHKKLLARNSIIEKRKEQERHLLEMEREEETKSLKI